jgi:S-formylglutathione hydrolase FrmB
MALLQCCFASETLGTPTTMTVLLPGDPVGRNGPHVPETGFPCLLLLHGLSDDHTVWQRRTSIERYVEPLGLAVVMPAAGRSFYADMVNGGAFWTFVAEELPSAIRTFFRLSDRREDNFVAGLSMGGFGAFKLALNHPDRFCAAASLSGVLDLASRTPLPPDDPLGRDFGLIFGDGADIRGSEDDLPACAERLVRSGRPRPALYQCCGTEDDLYWDNTRFRDRALELGLELTYEEGPGRHEWGYWDRQIQNVLAWLPLNGPK